MGWKHFLWTCAACLGMAALLAACGSAQTGSPEPPAAAASPGSTAAALPPATSNDSPMPTPGQSTRLPPEGTRLPGLVPGLTPEGTAPLELDPGFTPQVKPLPEIVPGVTPRPPVTGEVPAGILDAIIADLAGRLGVRSDDIEVVRDESVVWNDGSLGCPEPGMMYTQALVEGYWVVLEHEGRPYDYRATTGGYFRPCENPAAGQPGMPGGGETE